MITDLRTASNKHGRCPGSKSRHANYDSESKSEFNRAKVVESPRPNPTSLRQVQQPTSWREAMSWVQRGCTIRQQEARSKGGTHHRRARQSKNLPKNLTAYRRKRRRRAGPSKTKFIAPSEVKNEYISRGIWDLGASGCSNRHLFIPLPLRLQFG